MVKEIIKKDYNRILGNIIGYIEQSKLKLSKDLRLKYPSARGYSIRNLWNMKRFYGIYQKLQTLSAELLFSISWSNHIKFFYISNEIIRRKNLTKSSEKGISQIKSNENAVGINIFEKLFKSFSIKYKKLDIWIPAV